MKLGTKLKTPTCELEKTELQVIVEAIETHLKKQRVLKAVVREVEVRGSEKMVEGYVEIPCAVTRNNCLFDFEATLSEQTRVTRLTVNGSPIFIRTS